MKWGTFAWYWAAAAGVIGFLWLVGLPVQLLLDELGGRRGRPVAAPMFGLSVVVVGSWYTLAAGHSVSGLPIVLGLAAIVLTGSILAVRVLVRRRPLCRQELRQGIQRLVTAATVFALNMVISVFTIGEIYAKGTQTVASLGNSDIANYALFAQRFLEASFRQLGPVVGYNMGSESKRLGYGADAILAFVAAVLRTDVLHVLHLTMLVAVIIGVSNLTRLLNERLGVQRSIAIVASQAAYAVFLVVYVEGQYFLSQVLAMALLPAVVALLIDVVATDSRRAWFAGIAGLACLSATGIAMYPQIVVPMVLMFLPAVVWLGRLRGLVARSIRATSCAVCGVVLGVALVPALSRIGWHETFSLASAKAGNPLPGVVVTDLLGFQTNATSHHSQVSEWLMALVLLGFAALTGWLWRRNAFVELTAFGSAAVTTILLSYLLVFWYEGVSYQQWKWITFFTPLFVALFVAQTLSALSRLNSPLLNGPAAARAVGTGYLLTVVALATPAGFAVNATPFQPSPDLHALPTFFVSPDAAAIDRSAQVRALPAVNIRVGAYWDSMWLVYFLRGKRLYLQSLTYYGTITKPGAEWTIERNDMPSAAKGAVRLNDTYRLVRSAPT